MMMTTTSFSCRNMSRTIFKVIDLAASHALSAHPFCSVRWFTCANEKMKREIDRVKQFQWQQQHQQKRTTHILHAPLQLLNAAAAAAAIAATKLQMLFLSKFYFKRNIIHRKKKRPPTITMMTTTTTTVAVIHHLNYKFFYAYLSATLFNIVLKCEINAPKMRV